MQAINTTRNSTLCTTGVIADNFWTRLRGLMFRPSLPEGEGLLLQGESSIHTFFMRFPIDVVYLDGNNQVMRLAEAMPPTRVGPLVWGCRAILELPPGTIARTATQVGDTLEIVA
jgi:uncharacterized membrane protein (UPF0127 family)